MRRYWWPLGIVAVLAGLYYLIMSGYMTERRIAFTLKHGVTQPSVDDQYADLCSLEATIDDHERRTATLRSLTRGSSTEGIEDARAAVAKRLEELRPLLGRSDDDQDVQDAFDRTARFFRDWRPAPLSCLSPKAYMWSTVIFWVTFALAVLSGLVRVFAGPED